MLLDRACGQQAAQHSGISTRFKGVSALRTWSWRRTQRGRPDFKSTHALALTDDTSLSRGITMNPYDLGKMAKFKWDPAAAEEQHLLDVEPVRVLLNRMLDARTVEHDLNAFTQQLNLPDSSNSMQNGLHKSHAEDALPPQAFPAASREPASGSDADDGESTETCIITHPGSMCCSTKTVHKDSATKTVVINLTTTVRLADSCNSSLTMSELEQLGYMAGAVRMQEAASALSTAHGSRTAQSRHDATLDLLSRGRVVNAEKTINGFGHVTYKCVLQDPDSCHTINAIFKPCVEGHCSGWHRAEVETVAYRLNRLLGMDYIPPCVYRPVADVDWQHFEHGGIFMYWANNGEELRCQPMDRWGAPSQVVLSDARVLDVLIQNSDRHHGHFLWAEHWAHTKKKGSGSSKDAAGSSTSPVDSSWAGVPAPVFIDHAAGFRPEALVDLRHNNAFNTGETQHISARTYLRLRCLDRSMVSSTMGSLITPAEVDALMRQREIILEYFDNLVRDRGYSNVVIEAPGL